MLNIYKYIIQDKKHPIYRNCVQDILFSFVKLLTIQETNKIYLTIIQATLYSTKTNIFYKILSNKDVILDLIFYSNIIHHKHEPILKNKNYLINRVFSKLLIGF